MKKLLLLALLAFPLAIARGEGTSPAVDAQGHALATIDFAGAKTCNIDNGSGLVAVWCASGPAIVYGVIASSIAATDFLTIFDTNVAGTLSASTATVIFANGTGANASGASTTELMKFPVPLKVTNGITLRDANAPTAGGAARWTVLYRSVNTSQQ